MQTVTVIGDRNQDPRPSGEIDALQIEGVRDRGWRQSFLDSLARQEMRCVNQHSDEKVACVGISKLLGLPYVAADAVQTCSDRCQDAGCIRAAEAQDVTTWTGIQG